MYEKAKLLIIAGKFPMEQTKRNVRRFYGKKIGPIRVINESIIRGYNGQKIEEIKWVDGSVSYRELDY